MGLQAGSSNTTFSGFAGVGELVGQEQYWQQQGNPFSSVFHAWLFPGKITWRGILLRADQELRGSMTGFCGVSTAFYECGAVIAPP